MQKIYKKNRHDRNHTEKNKYFLGFEESEIGVPEMHFYWFGSPVAGQHPFRGNSSSTKTTQTQNKLKKLLFT